VTPDRSSQTTDLTHALTPRNDPESLFTPDRNVLMNMFFHFIFLARPRTEPYTEYRVIVIAFTLKYDGEPSDPVIQRTDIAGPSAPQIINLTCHSQDALYLQWKRPTTFYNSIDFYVINYKESSYSNFQQIQLNTTAAFAETAVCGHSMLLLFRLCL
jgi:hypothetical protein